tara:strand:- start:585 stop:731 length:147 start_codon:yes stop_codon:yes gene_type:complete
MIRGNRKNSVYAVVSNMVKSVLVYISSYRSNSCEELADAVEEALDSEK